jgi:hypothetical protein
MNLEAKHSTSTAGRIALWLLITWAGVQLGAGVYEKRVVVPMWASEPSPQSLANRLADSGHTASSTRFWPFVSPVVFLLAITNAVFGWRHRGAGRSWWLTAAFGFVLISIATYAYFVPTMLSMMHGAEEYTPGELERAVAMWTGLSWLRTILAVPIWLAAVKALTLLPRSTLAIQSSCPGWGTALLS